MTKTLGNSFINLCYGCLEVFQSDQPTQAIRGS